MGTSAWTPVDESAWKPVSEDTPTQEDKPGALSQIGTSLKNQAKGLIDLLLVPFSKERAQRVADGLVQSHVDQFKEAQSAFKDGDYAAAIHHGLGAAVPLIGPAIEQAAEKATKGGKPYEAITDLVAAPLISHGIGAAGKMVNAGINAAGKVGEATATGLMRSALKPGVADATTIADAKAVVKTALEHEIPVSEAGSAKLNTLIKDYGQRVQDVVDAKAQSGAKVDPNAVAARINQVDTTQVLPEKDIADVSRARQAFLTRKGQTAGTPAQPTGVLDAKGNPIMSPGKPGQSAQPVPFDVAQAEKQGTYRQNAAKYGELSNAQMEAEKALARGYKEEMELQAPELKLLNAKEAEFLNLQPSLERAIRRAANQDIVDFKGVAETGAGAAAAGPLGAAAGFTTRVLDFPGIKSKLAIAINKASQRSGTPLSMAASTSKAAKILATLATQAGLEANKE